MDNIVSDSVNPPEKRCTKCKQSKPATLEYFSANKTRPDGLQHRCKECVKAAWKLAHPKTPKPPKKQNAPEGYKRCISCKQVKPATEEYFYVCKSQADLLDYYCKDCKSEKAKARYTKKRPDYTAPPGYKMCHKCREVKPATEEYFHIDTTKHDGFVVHCKDCKNAYGKQYTLDNKEDVNARQRKRRANHLEEYRERDRVYYRNNREKFSVYSKRYYLFFREAKLEYQRRYFQTHKEQVKEANNRYRIAHQAECNARGRNRRARVRNAEGSHTKQDIQRQYNAQRGKCYYCHKKLGDRYHVDHIVPIARGGSNGPDNLVVACPTCNCSKKDKLLHEWIGGGRLV